MTKLNHLDGARSAGETDRRPLWSQLGHPSPARFVEAALGLRPFTLEEEAAIANSPKRAQLEDYRRRLSEVLMLDDDEEDFAAEQVAGRIGPRDDSGGNGAELMSLAASVPLPPDVAKQVERRVPLTWASEVIECKPGQTLWDRGRATAELLIWTGERGAAVLVTGVRDDLIFKAEALAQPDDRPSPRLPSSPEFSDDGTAVIGLVLPFGLEVNSIEKIAIHAFEPGNRLFGYIIFKKTT